MVESVKLIPILPVISAILCAICCMNRKMRSLAGTFCVIAIGLGFVVSLLNYETIAGSDKAQIIKLFDWIQADAFTANFSFYFDSLTMVMLFVVTGIGTLVALYATGYMKGDPGYARFFVGVSLFIFAMTTLVMADNLVLLYLGWEGVGLCSYLLIGFYYQKPSAVAAAKKAFIVNRIGDLGFALGIFLTYQVYGTVEFEALWPAIERVGTSNPVVEFIPLLLMLGAFGKSAQIPLYMWLPDAMEGPTPVSALIHAATMVTAGVYMIARLMPLFEMSQSALPIVAVVGGFTALFAASIALCQYDIKRIFAYSTISQLGYMFLGVGVLSSTGAVFHLFTHAFFKALLFLTAGSVMHALAGQLDLRKMSGLRTKLPWTCWLMFVGCLALAGVFPFAGFFSKDMILAAAMEKGYENSLFEILAYVGLLTAFMTAYYTFRLWFRVFMGPTHYEMGDEHHDSEDDHGHDQDHAHHDAHEMPFWPMNAPLVVLAIGSVFAGWLGHDWMEGMIEHSSAAVHGVHSEHAEDVHHKIVLYSTICAVAGILLAAWYHWLNRPAAESAAARNAGVVRLLENKYYIDEILDAVVVRPLRALGHVFFAIDQLLIDGLVNLVGFLPRGLGLTVQPAQRGVLQGYGVGMLMGLVILIVLIFGMI